MTNRTCLWPGCTVEVPAPYWGCRPHWLLLPNELRNLHHRHCRGDAEKQAGKAYEATMLLIQNWICVQLNRAQAASDQSPVAT